MGEAGEPRVLEEVSSGEEEEEGDEVEVEEEVDERGRVLWRYSTRCLRHAWWINRPAFFLTFLGRGKGENQLLCHPAVTRAAGPGTEESAMVPPLAVTTSCFNRQREKKRRGNNFSVIRPSDRLEWMY